MQRVAQGCGIALLWKSSCNLSAKRPKALATDAGRVVRACKPFATCKHHCRPGSTSDHAAGPVIGNSPKLDHIHLAELPCLHTLHACTCPISAHCLLLATHCKSRRCFLPAWASLTRGSFQGRDSGSFCAASAEDVSAPWSFTLDGSWLQITHPCALAADNCKGS